MSSIYVSSTFKDLEECRRQVRLVLDQMKHESVAMEYYVAENQPPLNKCLADVASCDLYIGIFAWKYGSIPVGKDKSFTELEYEKAVEAKKDCLIFLLHEEAPWPKILMDKGDDESKIENLRNKLSKKHTVRFFKSPQELASLVGVAVHNYLEKERGKVPLKKEVTTDLDIEKYRNAILKRYKILDLDALTPPEKADYMEFHLRSVFVEQDVRENPPPVELPKELMEKLIKGEKLKKEDLPEGITFEDIKKAKEAYLEKPALPVLDVIMNLENRYIVILGDPGSGKSTISRYLVLSLLTKEDEKLQKSFNKYLPLLIELRDYVAECAKNKCNTFIEYLDFQGETKGYGLTKEAINNYLKNDGKAIVIFDGLDEIFDPSQRENIEQQIIGFTTIYPKIRVIATSRIVGYKRRNLTNAGFSHYTLQDFRKPQIDIFIDKWYSIALIKNPDEARARKERINRAIEESASIRQLASNPLLLTIMAIINKHQELPRERSELYKFASSVLIYNWEWERKIKEWNIKIEYVSKDDKEELLRRLAYQMQSAYKGVAGNYIHADTLQLEFEKYFKERYQKNPADAKMAALALIEQLRERNFILCRYGSDLYGFIHRTFLEYFCAWSIVWKFNVKHEFDIEDLKSIFNEHWDDEPWHEVLRLICGMIDEKFSEVLILNLMQRRANDEPFRKARRETKHIDFIKRIDLAIKCMGELKNIELIRPTSSKLLKETCELIDLTAWSNYDHYDYDAPKFLNGVIPSWMSIGNRWAGREQLAEWILSAKWNVYGYRWVTIDPHILGKFIGSIGSGDKRIGEAVVSLFNVGGYKIGNNYLNNVAITALSVGWRGNPETLKMLEDYVRTIVSARTYAAKKISEGCIDNSLLFNVARLDDSFEFRQFAVKLIGKIWQKDNNALTMLKDRAINDTYSGVRETAISLLGEQWKDDPAVLSMLRERTSKEPNPALRNIINRILDGKDIESKLL